MQTVRSQSLPLTPLWQLAVTIAVSVSLSSVVSAQTACDLDNSGTTNVVDVTRAVNMVLGTVPCTANVEGPQQCSIVTVQRVVNAVLGQPCVTYNSSTHSVSISWLASASAGVVGYNVYRRTPSTSFTKINSAVVTGTSFNDNAVLLNTTYIYAATSVDANGNESVPSAEVTAVIPAT